MRIHTVFQIVDRVVNPQIIPESSFGSTSKDEILRSSILERIISQWGLLRCRSTDLCVIVVANRKGFMAMTAKDTVDCTLRRARPVIVHPRPFMRHAVGSVKMNSQPLRFILLSARPLQTRDKLSPVVDISTSPGDNSCTELACVWALVIVIRHCLRNFSSPVTIPLAHCILLHTLDQSYKLLVSLLYTT